MRPQTGETVRIHYTGTLADGTEFDSSSGRDPLLFTMGEGAVIPGFEAAVADLEAGESVTVTIPADEAYGPRHEDGVQTVPREAFGETVPLAGWVVTMEGPSGEQIQATIMEADDDFVVMDFNHPLSGQDLTFALTLVEIVGR
ncbi:MAG: peptidylprolyl isomerase [Actinobacteria bacterium]|nr:peptidylprolyl isomerase [Actinomycetota bacterium]